MNQELGTRRLLFSRMLYRIIPYSLFLIPLLAHAALLPCSGLDCKIEHLYDLAVNIYNFLLSLAALVALCFLIVGGMKMFLFSFSGVEFGQDPQAVLTGAKKTIARALIGLVIIVAAYLIANTILIILGVTDPACYLEGHFLDPGGC